MSTHPRSHFGSHPHSWCCGRHRDERLQSQRKFLGDLFFNHEWIPRVGLCIDLCRCVHHRGQAGGPGAHDGYTIIFFLGKFFTQAQFIGQAGVVRIS